MLRSERFPYENNISAPYSFSSCLGTVWSYAKTPLVYLLSFAGTVPTTTYAGSLIMGYRPELWAEVWPLIPIPTKMLALAVMTVVLGMGTLMRASHLPSFAKKLYDMFSHCFEDAGVFFKNNIVMAFALATAVASFATGYYGYLWGGAGTALCVGTINFFLTLGFRAESMAALIEKCRNLFNEDDQFQKAVLHELKFLKKEHVQRFDEYLKESVLHSAPLTEETIKTMLLKIYDEAQAGKEENVAPLFHAPHYVSHIKTILCKIIDTGFGLVSGGAFFLYSTEMGNRGYLLLCQLAFPQCGMEKWPYAAKLALSMFSGLSSGVLAFLSGIETSNTVQIVGEYGKKSRGHTGLVCLIIGGSMVSGVALAGAAYVITLTPNLFNIMPNSIPAYIFISATEFMALLYDVQSIMLLAAKNDVSYAKAIQWLEKNKLSSESVQALRQHSYFKKPEETTKLLDDNRPRWSYL